MQDFPPEAMEVMEDIDQQGYMINIIFIWKALDQQRLYEYTSNLNDILRVIEELKRQKEEKNREQYVSYRRDRSSFIESSFRLVSISKANKPAPLVDHSNIKVREEGSLNYAMINDNRIDKVLLPFIGGFPIAHFPYEEVLVEYSRETWWKDSYEQRQAWINRETEAEESGFLIHHATIGDNKLFYATIKDKQLVFVLINKRSSKYGWWWQKEADAYTVSPPKKFDSEKKMIDDLSQATGLPTYQELRDGTWRQRNR
jgi:hypothetical protein